MLRKKLPANPCCEKDLLSWHRALRPQRSIQGKDALVYEL